jgi:UbiD family decarboxylase
MSIVDEPAVGAQTPSFGGFLEVLRRELPRDLLVIEEAVNPATFDVTAVARHLEMRGNFPALLFTRPLNLRGEPSEIALATNMYATRERCALMLGLPVEQSKLELSLRMAALEQAAVPPVVVDQGAAPVKEVVRRGADADLRDLPLVRHHEMDPGPYIDMTVVLREPESGAYNMSFQRAMYKEPRKTGIYMAPRHNWEIVRRYRQRGEPTPAVIVASHHPAFYLGSLNVQPFGVDDYAVVGSHLGAALRLTASETWGDEFLVPADADLVIEGEIPPDEMEAEGPFGEWTSLYGPQRMSPVFYVTAITHRRGAVHQDILVSHRDDCILGALAKEGAIYNAIKASIPTVKAVHLGLSGNSRFHVYVSIDKKVEGEAMWAGVIAASVFNNFKTIVIVDADIDVYNEEEVWFAVAMRTEVDKDIQILRDIKSSPLDPAMSHPTKKALMIVDATSPLDRPAPTRVRVPPEALERVRLERLVDPSALQALPIYHDWKRSM